MNRIRIIAGLGVCALLMVGAVFAIQGQSSSYNAQPQALTSGSGASASASYSSPQQALGPLTGVLSSTSYGTTVGAVQPASQPPEPTSVDEWRELAY